MALFKDLNNAIHDDDDGRAFHLLPYGSVKITKEEATILLTPPPTVAERKAAKQREIDGIESAYFMTRGEREAWIATTLEAASQKGVPEPVLYASNAFYQKMKDVNTQVTQLRAELKAIK